ncbi:MAG: formate--tetrahydrofolate ligase [Candidatus Saganbacteria bacterium]|nr:formate--tetrahydrofolate ligase [Candidatus Saganbacteria bacterium]
MVSDIEIAKKCKLLPIEKIAASLGLKKSEIELYGRHIAKIYLSAYKKRVKKKDGSLILVTTISPTPFGEGKTTVTIGLAQALKKIGKKTMVCIREPSLGPTMGIKGGAAGGGYSQVLPMEDINLHFTGDMYMVGAAHNLLAAMIDNHLYFGNELGIDKDRITWTRVVDMNDRALRSITYKFKEIERTAQFEITAASEVMSVICLSMSIAQMKEKLGRIVVGFSKGGEPVTACDLKASGAMALLLKEAIKPNLVQTVEGVPAFVHGGPFANIAHGCNSLIATKLALKLADYVVTEAGFGSDLGAEKFFDIKCRTGALKPSCIVLVITTKALKWQGGAVKDKYKDRDEEALKKGFANMDRHVAGLRNYGIPVIGAVNKYDFDSPEEIKMICDRCKEIGIKCVVCDVRENGGKGGIGLAKEVAGPINNKKADISFLYDVNASIEEKIRSIAVKIYGADGVEFSEQAKTDLGIIKKKGYSSLPVCIAKNQFSFTDDHTRLGAPAGFTIKVKKMKIAAGAGFIIAYLGDIMTMPGLPKHPAAENMDIDDEGCVRGIF